MSATSAARVSFMARCDISATHGFARMLTRVLRLIVSSACAELSGGFARTYASAHRRDVASLVFQRAVSRSGKDAGKNSEKAKTPRKARRLQKNDFRNLESTC